MMRTEQPLATFVDRPTGDQPAGPDSQWRADFGLGFHVMLDAQA